MRMVPVCRTMELAPNHEMHTPQHLGTCHSFHRLHQLGHSLGTMMQPPHTLVLVFDTIIGMLETIQESGTRGLHHNRHKNRVSNSTGWELRRCGHVDDIHIYVSVMQHIQRRTNHPVVVWLTFFVFFPVTPYFSSIISFCFTMLATPDTRFTTCCCVITLRINTLFSHARVMS